MAAMNTGDIAYLGMGVSGWGPIFNTQCIGSYWMLIFTTTLGYIASLYMQVRFSACNDKQHWKKNWETITFHRTSQLSSSPWCCLSLVCQVPFSSQCCLAVFPLLSLFFSFHPSLVISFHHCPVHLISSTFFSFLPSLSLCCLSPQFFLWQWMRDGGQLVDAGVSKILSAHRSFGIRSRSRTPVILALHRSQGYILATAHMRRWKISLDSTSIS